MKSFLIPSLLAAGFGPHDPAQSALTHATTTGADDPNAGKLLRVFQQDHLVTLAQHRSHSSHSSHRSGSGGHSSHMSHTSHRSSTGGYGGTYTPQPVYTAPSPAPPPPPADSSLYPPSVRASPPAEGEAAPLRALPGRSKRFAAIVRRVQIALLAQGAYSGAIDGVVGPALRAGIRKFQNERSLEVTGTITPQLLDALRVASE